VHHRAGWLDHPFVWLTQSARLGLLWIAIGVVLAVVRRRPALLVPLVGADLTADLLSGAIKSATDRPRPPVRYPVPHALIAVPRDGSFPSGHAATSFACATVLSVFAPRLAPGFLVLAAAVAFSRVYVGVHYPLDVIGGALLGVLVGAGWVWLWRRYGARPPRALRMPAAARRRSRRSPRSG
jgi:undecaprenyl-diphosphatase